VTESIAANASLGALNANSAREEKLIEHVGRATDRTKVKELSKQFESVFLEIVMRSMRNTIPKSELVEGGNAEDIYKGMLDTEYSKMMANTNTSKLAGDIERQLLENMGLKPEVNRISQEIQGRTRYESQALHPSAKQAKILSEKRF
jgi:flagellar protein FlgJ